MKIAEVKEMLKDYCETEVKQMETGMERYQKIFKKEEIATSVQLNLIMETFEQCKERMYGYFRATIDIIEKTNKVNYGKLSNTLFPIYTEYRDKASKKHTEISDKIITGNI